VKRILVIKDVGLWISLNRCFAGGSSVRLSEAATLETGLRLARIEVPDLVVCSTESAEHDAASLQSRLGDVPKRVRVVCVDKDAPESVPAADRFMLCRPDRFLDTVARAVGGEETSAIGPRVDQLVHFEIRASAGQEPRRGFASLIEVGESEILITSDEGLETGDQLALTFFVPAAGDPAGARRKVALSCEVRACRDPNKLVYVASVRPDDEESDRAFRRYVRASQRAEESRP